MRVTNQSMVRNSQTRLQNNLQAVERARRDISTGRRLHAMSDDPSAGSELVRLGSGMRAIEQYRRNIRLGTARATAEENVLDGLTGTLSRAIDLSISQSSSTATAQTRQITKNEVDQLLSQAVALGNSKFGDEYLFGGTRAGQPPLRVPPGASDGFSALVDANGDPVDPSGSIEVEIGDGKFVTPNHNATDVFLSTDVLESLRALSTALGNNDQAAIASATGRLTRASSEVQNLIGGQGARSGEMLGAADMLDASALSMQSFQADLRATEMETTMIELVARQNQYEAAMAATSRVLGLSLANYI